jgi:hypothetical protein
MSGALYHCISKWWPAAVPEEVANQNITPGRISTVFFFPETSLHFLEGKPRLWSKSTMGGKARDAQAFNHSTAKEKRKGNREAAVQRWGQ